MKIQSGRFEFLPTYDDVEDNRTTESRVVEEKKSYGNKTDVF